MNNNLRFNRHDQPEFFKELRKRVNDYFKTNDLSVHANRNMKIKTAFMLSVYFVPLIALLLGWVSGFWPVMLMWIIMGLGMAGIGTSVMHDAIHGAYSKNKKANRVLGFLIHFIGGSSTNWKIQHNHLHHSFTNVDGFDEDIEVGVMRFSPNQNRKWFHRFQAFYAVILYSVMTLHWSLTKDFVQLKRYDRKNLLTRHGFDFRKEIVKITAHKMWYFVLTLVLPMIFIDLPWWQILIGYVAMHLVCGLGLALIFQTAHVINETEFYKPEPRGDLENSWAIHQLRTTANFAPKSVVFSWLIGGLNYQIEHHLFPHICHVHYPKIASIVRSTAKEYGIPYFRHPTFAHAVTSHFSLLNRLGTRNTI